MKKLFILLAIATLTFGLGSCRDQAPSTHTNTREVIREVEVPVKEEPTRDGILERTGKKVDKKVNDEIDKKLDEID